MITLQIIGNLTRDPETRSIVKDGNESKVTTFTVAGSTGWGDHKRTEFVRVSAWNGDSKKCAFFLRKGSKVFVAGPVSVNCYVNSAGQAVGNLEMRLETIEFLSPKPADAPIYNEETDEDIEDLL